MKEWVSIAALIFSAISFLIFVVDAIRMSRVSTAGPVSTTNSKAANLAPAAVPTLPEVTEFAKAMATLVDSLAKAGPALTSLIGSIFFLVIAAVSAGILVGK